MISPIPLSSRINRIVLVFGIACLLASFAGVILVGAHKNDNNLPTDASVATAPPKARIAEQFGKLPLSFEANKGQIDQSVKFMSHGPGYDLFLTSTEAVLKVQKSRALPADKTEDANVREGSVLRLTLLGANSNPQFEGQDELPGKVNYFTGNDPEKWRRNIPTYRRVYFKEVYPGIDLVYYGNQRELEYDLVVAAGANPKLIRFSVAGAEQIRLDRSGKLLLSLKHGDVTLNKPVIYQTAEDGSRREVKGTYAINGNEIRFKLDRFDTSKPLIIDPVLSYSTLLGSGFNENGFGIAVDSQGSAYVTGTTDNSSFPTTAGAFKSTSTRGGAFVTKFDPSGSTLVYSTYLSGEGQTSAFGIAVDSSGNAHVTGNTNAPDFPIVNSLKTASNFFKTTDAATSWSNQNTGLGVSNVNVLAVAPSAPNTVYAGAGDGLYRSTDGGSTWTKLAATGLTSLNFANTMAVDPANSLVVYVAQSFGLFKSTDGGANFTAVNAAPLNTPFVFTIAFDPATPSTMYLGTNIGVFKSTDSGSTWITQNNFNIPGTPNVHALAIDPTAPSTIYAGTIGNGLFKSTNGGGVWTAMNNGMGGGNPTQINAIVIDPANPSTVYTGHAFFGGGINKSTNGGASWTPLTNGIPNNGVNSMVATSSAVYAVISSQGIIKSTNGGDIWTSSDTGLWSPNVNTLVKHPTDPAILYAGTIGSTFSDVFVTKLNSTGSGLLFSTFVGGSRDELGNGIAVDGNGNIAVVGQTFSANFPLANAVRSSVIFEGNCGTAFVTKMNPAASSYVFSTYLGGGRCDVANGVATDSSGNVYVTGRTSSTDFPTANAFQPAISGTGQFVPSDAFVSKLTPAGSFVYSTYLGGTSDETGFGIATDSSGNAYVTGSTTSTNFPTMNPIQTSNGGSNGDVFVTKFNSQGSALVYSTYLGGTGFESSRGIALDAANNAYVTGFSDSSDFPLVAGALRTKSAVYKSIDNAANWSNDNYGFTGASALIGTTTVSGFAINPTQTSTVYAATGKGVFKTTNGGRTWGPVNNGLPASGTVALVMNPSSPSTLYAAISDLTSNTGVYKTTDGGGSWVKRSNGIFGSEIHSLAIDPVTPNTLYVGVSFCCGLGSRVYKTTDGADNWGPVGNSPPVVPSTLTVDPLSHLTIYATDAATPGLVQKSIDGGATWQPLSATVAFARSITISPLIAGVVYAGTDQGVFRSTDGGTSWTQISSKAGKIVLDPVNSSTLYLLTNPFSFQPEGLFRSTDNGQTFVPMNKGLNAPVAIALAIDPVKPSTLYLASSVSGGTDAFVTKINPAGNGLVYSTFLGGPVNPDFFFGSPNAQAFAIAVDASSNAYITGTTSSLGFAVTPTSYQPFNRGFNDAFISKLSTSYIISGRVLNNGLPGSPLGGAEIILNDGTSLTSVTSESDGSYEFSRLRAGANYTVTAALPHFTLTPASQTFNNLQSDQVLDFSALTSDSNFQFISGQITENGVPVSGVTVTLSGSQPGIRTTDSNGNYSFQLISGGDYTVTPTRTGFNFGPTSQTFNHLNVDQTANFTATRQNFVVTNANNHGAGSLRDAIINANATPGTDTITFNIPGPAVKTINLLIALPEITDRVVIDATTQPGYAGTPLIEIDGLALGSNGNGLVVKAGGSTVRGLSIGNFRGGFGIWLNGCDNNVIQGNYLGVAADGTTARQNFRGVVLNNSSNNQIGGTTAAARNVVSGNSASGIDITGNNNVVQGNYIGTNAAGTAALGQPGGVSMSSSNSTDNVIGGTAPGAGNLISGNQFGITGVGNGTIIQGNLIGTDVTGTARIPNSLGIQAIAQNVLIGGLTASARNVISGNSGDGVSLRGAGNKLQGNYIGTDITGTLALGNNGAGVSAGENALIGGTEPGARNIITASGNSGNVALGNNNTGAAAIVQGNYIGTDVTGTRALPGPIATAGISIFSNNNIIGGTTAAARNVISGNSTGILFGSFFGGPVGNTIQGNFIGVNAAGTGPLPNTQQGIGISDAVNNTIGGTQNGAGNTIAFNGLAGISITTGTGNSIRGNSIFSNNGLGIDLGGDGVTANDTNDSDSGPNQRQNFPLITSVLSTSNSTTIQGSLKSIPSTTFQIDFFSNVAVDPSGNGEGAQFFNTTSVNTDANGDATINVTVPVGLAAGRVITATATDPNGNTSEFSAADSSGTVGSVQFSIGSINVIEDVGMLTVTVLRTGGATGNVSVDYLTQDGTAIAGQDYTSASGTLTFAGGETSKTFQIPIADDATTEPDETFSVALRNASSLESLGAPAILNVTIQDRTTQPGIQLVSATVVEGDAGTTTNAVFTINLSAATGRAVTGNYATSNLSAFGGAACGTQGVDYETKSGTFSFQPGTTTFTIPVKICGDTSAEANETFRITLTNIAGAGFIFTQTVGTIVNDDVLGMILEDGGPVQTQAAALDAYFAVRDPFRVFGLPEWFVGAPDQNTRVMLFARNLQLNPGEAASGVIVRIVASNNQIFSVFAEDVRLIPGTEFTQVVIRLPNLLPPGTCTVSILAHTRTSNTGTIRIVP
jgi:hypothetical protein